ncbi:MAG: Alpha/beta hydrolase family protein [Acidimicrobiales bacterium]|nr:Alpha/beta hydrolase family protein [Acidimicrobiales bacterium]
MVLFPPLGVEYNGTHRAMRLLARRLEAAGFAVLRFDYDGTGDSAGRLDDDGRVEAWLDNGRTAVATMRATGVERVAVVGLRMGATLAAEVAQRDERLDALVLWDPCRSGRSFLREQRALRVISLGAAEAPPDTVGAGAPMEVTGYVYTPDTVMDLASIDITKTDGRLADRVLALLRPERPDRRLTERLEQADADWQPAPRQAELVDVEPPLAVEPEETLDDIVRWMDKTLPRGSTEVVLPPANDAIVGHDDTGRAIVERFESLGPVGLFGIWTTPPRPVPGPTVLFLNVSTEPHTGPSRLWVDLARELAVDGITSVRFDLSGLAESPARPGQAEHVVYAPEALDDVADVARAVSPADPANVVLVGLCSGGYTAIDSGITLSARSVCAINPSLTYRPPDVAAGTPDPRRQVSRPGKKWLHALGNACGLVALKDRLPEYVWTMLDRVGIDRSPLTGLERLVERADDVLLICDPGAAKPLRRRGPTVLRRLEESGRFRLVVLDNLDHGMLRRQPREVAVAMLTAHLRARFGRTVERSP